MLANESYKQTTVQMNQDLLMDMANSHEIFACSHHSLGDKKIPMRTNVLMFHDTDENVLKAINI